VGDKVDAATTLGELLRLWGHEVQTVHDGLEAIEIARVYQPEVIILDIG
jgi:CheY-like chemotaxis protein